MIIHNPILTGSFTVNGTDVSSITSSAASLTSLNAYTASQNNRNGTYATTGSNTFAGIQTVNSNLVVTGSITAQTLVVQTVTSSVVYSSGSNVFGNNIANTQVFTGSMNLTGSLTVVTTGTELQVTSTGVNIGNALTDSHVISGSLRVNPNGLFVSSSGLVGIGTISPNIYTIASQLVVDAGANGGGITIKTATTSSTTNYGGLFFADGVAGSDQYRGFIQYNHNFNSFTDTLIFGTAGTEKMYITSAGNVGIGTNNPGFTLHVLSTGASMGLFSTTSATGGFVGFRYNTNTTIGYVGNGNQLVTGGGVGDIALTAESGNILFATNAGAERMRITSAGNVGIGTTSPVTFGTTNLDVNAGSGGAAYIVVRNSSNAQTIELAMDGGVGYLSTKSNHPLRIRTNDASRIIVTSIASGGWFKAANDGTFINTNGNYHELTSNRANDNVVYMSNTSGTPYGPFIWFVNATPNNTTSYFLAGTDSVNDKFIIYSNGTYGSRTGTYGSIISDIKYKQDITDANSQWDDIKNLRVRNFRYKEDVQNEGDNALRQIGFIAQEVEQVSPGLVYEAGKKDTDETWKSVKTSIIEIKAIKALQEAMARIEQLEAEIDELKNK